jgi:hypothetical protein
VPPGVTGAFSGDCTHATYGKTIEMKAAMKRVRIFTGSPENKGDGWKTEKLFHLFRFVRFDRDSENG